ncbi:MAG: CrcB protein [Mariniblastus sp.]|jgi:CrcB protein
MRTEFEWLLVALGGSIGAISRYGLTLASNRFLGSAFPFGTLLANLVGCFLAGLILGSGIAHKNDPIRMGVGIGFLGALTTFSTFGVETLTQFDKGHWGLAMGNVAANVILGLGFVFLGMLAGRRLA